MTASTRLDPDPRWDPGLVRRIVQIRSVASVSLGIAAMLLPMLGPQRFGLALLLIFAVPAASMVVAALFPADRVLATVTVVDMVWAVAVALLMPSVYGPAMLVATALLAFVANEETRGLVVASCIGVAGFAAAGAVHSVELAIVDIIVFVLLLPLLFFMAVTQRERELRHQVRIRHRVEHDGLTGLRNRAGLTAAMASAPVEAVIAIDLDGFKDINDTLGHDAGDELLIALSSRMSRVVGGAGVLARTGGDEFAVLVRHIDANVLAGDLLRALRHRVALGDIDVGVGASIGVATADGADPEDPAELLRRADLAMYEAKRAQGGIRRWSDKIRSASRQRVSLSGDVERAFDHQEFEVYFQPIVETGSGEVVDVEGLLRWRHPEHGLLTPDTFLALVEGIGRRSSMDRLVFDHAAGLAARLQRHNVGVSVNVSAGSLMRSSVPRVLSEVLRAHDVVAQRITVEVIEDEMIDEHSTARAVLSALGELGVGIAIDDFGTGHSSLSRLRRLPVTSLKIDRSFVSAMLTSDDDEAIVAAVSRLGQSLDLVVVAEGVETVEIRNRIVETGLPIDRLQGYGIARPMPADELVDWIESRRAVAAR